MCGRDYKWLIDSFSIVGLVLDGFDRDTSPPLSETVDLT
jgi:hypothetical protein